jgi:hypothetical protein
VLWVRVVEAPKTSRGEGLGPNGLQYGLQYMEPGGIPAFTFPFTFYLQIDTF